MSSVVPLCSIVIPVFNEGASLAGFLARLQPLRQSGVELVLVDASVETDISLWADFVDVAIASPRGRAVQMNAGAAVARGNYLLFLHADTLLPASFGDLLQAFFLQSVQWGFFTPRLSGSHWLLRIVERGMTWRSRFTSVATGDQALFVRREVFERCGGFPEQPLMEDVAISKRLRAIAAPLVWPDPVITSSRRWEQNGIIKTIVLMWWLRLLYVFGVSPQRLHQWYYGKPVVSVDV